MNRSPLPGKMNIAVVAFVLLAVAATVSVMASGRTEVASATSGGLGVALPKPTAATGPAAGGNVAVRGTRFGARVLREGMVGPDVTVLKSIVRSKRLFTGRPLTQRFDRPTTNAVRRFQRSNRMARHGVVTRPTARALIRSLGTGHASWYGPGLYGNGTACGKVTLRPRTIGLAHKTLPCGSRVLIGYRGRYIIAPVIDRGPYIPGRTWDLTAAAAKAVGLTADGVGTVRHALISRGR